MVGTDGIALEGANLATDGLGHAGGTIKIEPTTSSDTRAAISVEGVRLDVSMASGPVTVTLSMERGTGIAILTGPDTRNIIGDILPGVMVEVGGGSGYCPDSRSRNARARGDCHPEAWLHGCLEMREARMVPV